MGGGGGGGEGRGCSSTALVLPPKPAKPAVRTGLLLISGQFSELCPLLGTPNMSPFGLTLWRSELLTAHEARSGSKDPNSSSKDTRRTPWMCVTRLMWFVPSKPYVYAQLQP